MTLDELAAMLELPEGHYILALGDLPDGHVPGIALTIAHGDDVTPKLPLYKSTEPLLTMDLAQYRRWGVDRFVTRTALRPVEAGCADDCIHPSHSHRVVPRYPDQGYTPVTAPIAASDPKAWPKFPGEGLPITGNDPGDEDLHTGGPRL